MYNPFAQAVDSIKQAKPSRLSKTYSISLKKIITILLIAIVAVSSIVWATDRLNTHRNWASTYNEVFDFRDHMENVYLDPDGMVGYNLSLDQKTAHDETHYAISTLDRMQKLDKAHSEQLSRIEGFLINLSGLDATQVPDSKNLSTVNMNIRQIGNKVFNAYTSIVNYTSINSIEGPPFWYFGPSSPDEATLQEAVDLAVASKAFIDQ